MGRALRVWSSKLCLLRMGTVSAQSIDTNARRDPFSFSFLSDLSLPRMALIYYLSLFPYSSRVSGVVSAFPIATFCSDISELL